VEKIQLARKTGENPAPYVANARQWLAIVKLANPREAETLEQELKRATGALPALPAEPAPQLEDPKTERAFLLLRLAWLGVPVAMLFAIAGPDLGVKLIAGACLVGLLAFIFLK
jgi:hypothetical protein